MCGRFHLRTDAVALVQKFLPNMVAAELPAVPPRYNIAPTQPVLSVLADREGRRSVRFLRWGLVPPWADSLVIGSRMVNARCETAAEKRSFREPFAKRRCLVPATGYYEWQVLADGTKQPMHIHRPDDPLFAMAGLWERNTIADPEGREVVSCTLLTTEANQATAAVHDRMPVILDQAGVDRWLAADTEPAELQALCRPAPNRPWVVQPVSRRVNKPRFDDPACLEPESLPKQRSLFEIE